MWLPISGFDLPISDHRAQTPNLFHGKFLTLWAFYKNIDSFSSHLKTPLRNSRLKFQGAFVFFSVQSLLFSQHFGVLVLQLPLSPYPSAQWIHTQGDLYTRTRHPSSWDQTLKSNDTQGGGGGVSQFSLHNFLLSNIIWLAKMDLLGGWNKQFYLLNQWTSSSPGCQMSVKQQNEGHQILLLGTCMEGWGKRYTHYFYSKRSQPGSLSFIFLWLCQWDRAFKCNIVGSHETKFLSFPQEFHF